MKLSNRRRRIAQGLSGHSPGEIQKLLIQWEQDGYDISSIDLPTYEPKPKPDKGVGDFIAEDAQWISSVTANEECGCGKLQQEMNQLGPEGCLNNINSLSEKMSNNALKLSNSLRTLRLKSITWSPKLLKLGAKILIRRGIKKHYEAQQKKSSNS